jgi:hypothetical protein
MKRFSLLILLGFVLLIATDCIVSYPTMAPPALRAEVMVGRPGPGYFWMSGYWAWGGGGYYWVKSHWARTQRGKVWIDGRWEQSGGHWVWTKGYWR